MGCPTSEVGGLGDPWGAPQVALGVPEVLQWGWVTHGRCWRSMGCPTSEVGGRAGSMGCPTSEVGGRGDPWGAPQVTLRVFTVHGAPHK